MPCRPGQVGTMVNYAAIFLALRAPEIDAMKTHQKRIQSRDKDERRRAMKEYRQFLDYLVGVGRIDVCQRNALEHYRMGGGK